MCKCQYRDVYCFWPNRYICFCRAKSPRLWLRLKMNLKSVRSRSSSKILLRGTYHLDSVHSSIIHFKRFQEQDHFFFRFWIIRNRHFRWYKLLGNLAFWRYLWVRLNIRQVWCDSDRFCYQKVLRRFRCFLPLFSWNCQYSWELCCWN